ncbi:MAG: hypothetical protein Q8849_02505, partial [Candidatus Phytoplasma australasiaticum]|nr:hypothetical protein [Candidatus Phytoplasma australasiaticum]
IIDFNIANNFHTLKAYNNYFAPEPLERLEMINLFFILNMEYKLRKQKRAKPLRANIPQKKSLHHFLKIAMCIHNQLGPQKLNCLDQISPSSRNCILKLGTEAEFSYLELLVAKCDHWSTKA